MDTSPKSVCGGVVVVGGVETQVEAWAEVVGLEVAASAEASAALAVG